MSLNCFKSPLLLLLRAEGLSASGAQRILRSYAVFSISKTFFPLLTQVPLIRITYVMYKRAFGGGMKQ
jgi:hypothetical protein